MLLIFSTLRKLHIKTVFQIQLSWNQKMANRKLYSDSVPPNELGAEQINLLDPFRSRAWWLIQHDWNFESYFRDDPIVDLSSPSQDTGLLSPSPQMGNIEILLCSLFHVNIIVDPATLDPANYCKCNNCITQNTERESFCCQDTKYPKVTGQFSQSTTCFPLLLPLQHFVSILYLNLGLLAHCHSKQA